MRNPRERISIAELLEHPYLQLQPQVPEPGIVPLHTPLYKRTSTFPLRRDFIFCLRSTPFAEKPCTDDLKRILTELAALQSPNSIARAVSVSMDYRFGHELIQGQGI